MQLLWLPSALVLIIAIPDFGPANPSGRPANVEDIEARCRMEPDRRRHVLTMRFVWSAPAAQRFGQGIDSPLVRQIVADANAIAERIDLTVADDNPAESDFGCCLELRSEGIEILADPDARVAMDLDFEDSRQACRFLHEVVAPLTRSGFSFLVVSSLIVADVEAEGFFCGEGQAPVRRGIIAGSTSGAVLLHEVGHAQGLVHLSSETIDGQTVFDPQDYVMAPVAYGDDFPGSNRHLHCYECECYQRLPRNTELGHTVSGQCPEGAPPGHTRDGGIGAEDDTLIGCSAYGHPARHSRSLLFALWAMIGSSCLRQLRWGRESA